MSKSKKEVAKEYYNNDKIWVNAKIKHMPSPLQWENFKISSNNISSQQLLEASERLGYKITKEDCFKFIENNSKDKFIALFVVQSDKVDDRMLHSGSSHVWRDHNEIDTVECLGYSLLGYKYEDKWCFVQDVNYIFFSINIKNAKNEFIIKYLVEDDFFEVKEIISVNDFWNRKFRKYYINY